MKKIILLFAILIFITGCFNNKVRNNNIKDNSNFVIESESDTNMEIVTNIDVIIKKTTYKATLEKNQTAQAFTKLLPIEFNMSELNNNEKYIYMDNFLPSNPSNPQHIEKGDIMLYGNDCLVIFYQSFDTSYSYTKIGHINNLPNLGNGDITVKFEK